MSGRTVRDPLAAVFASVLVLLGAAVCPAGENYLSPVALTVSPNGKTLCVAEATAKQVAVVDAANGRITRILRTSAPPTGLTLTPDGTRLVVTCAGPKGVAEMFDVQTGKSAGTWPTGHTPMSPLFLPDGKTLVVCNRFDNNVYLIDTTRPKASSVDVVRIPVSREPVALAVSPDGKTLVVANHLPAGRADAAYVAAELSLIDVAAKEVSASVQLPNGATGVRGCAISPDGNHAFVTHTLARYHVPTTQLERGWMNTNALSIIDLAKKALRETVLLDDVDIGAANPWAVACTPDGKKILTTHAGTHEISVIDAAELFAKLAAAGQKPRDVAVRDDLSFLVGLRERIGLTGNGPRGLAVSGNTAYVAQYFTDDVAVLKLDEPVPSKRLSTIALGPKRKLTAVRRGEMLFNDGDMCFQKWQSCASCHPDVRADGLNWDLLNDGMGNPKNAKSLLLSHKTPPVMITGVRDKAETAVRAGIKHIQFVVRPEKDAADIDEYLKSVRPVASPYLVDGKLSEAARRGEKVFTKAGCGHCHPSPLYTDLKKYNVGTGAGGEAEQELDTPTLVEVWRTAPFLYDGRAVTMTEMLTKFNADDKHGITSKLSKKQIADLVEFILSQ
ncbi:MAG: cell surface protein [Planctomycetota bacterium]